MKGERMSESEELKELNHEEAEIAEAFDDLMDMWSFSDAMEIMEEVVSTLEKAGLTTEGDRTDVKEVLHQFGNRIRNHVLGSNYVFTMKQNYHWYLDNDRKRLEVRK